MDHGAAQRESRIVTLALKFVGKELHNLGAVGEGRWSGNKRGVDTGPEEVDTRNPTNTEGDMD